jgi:hypothetical protein
MNTRLLQEKHPKIYEEFFQQHELVFSCPFVTNRSGDILGNFAGIPIRQKIPLRMYIGVSLWCHELQLWKISYFDIGSGEFCTESMHTYSQYFIKYLNEVKKVFGHLTCKIDILTECSKSLWLWFTSMFNIWIITSLMYINKEFDHTTLYSSKNSTINKALQEKNGTIRKIFKTTMIMENGAWWEARLMPKIASFFDGRSPILGFREDNRSDYEDTKRSMNIYWFRLSDLREEIEESDYIPFDLSVLYTWKPLSTERVDDSYIDRVQFNSAKEKVYHKLKPYCWALSIDRKPRFYKQLLEPKSDIISHLYWKMIWTVSIEILHSLVELLSKNHNEWDLHNFIESLNKFKFANNLTRTNSEEYLKLLDSIESFFELWNRHIAIFPIESTISWWCIGIVSSQENTRNKVWELIEKYNKEKSNSISLVYSSWQDGYETEGIKIEQDLSVHIQSPFSKRANLKLINRDGSVYLRSYQEAIEDSYNDIVVDLIKNKIHMWGIICTSKELNSQFTTSEILSKLLLSGKKSIESKDLSPSSYTKNKNEMITKVINPFIKLIKQKFNKTLNVSCNGYVSGYIIEFDLKDLKVGILSEV